jgi:thymidylate synthase (FAD)
MKLIQPSVELYPQENNTLDGIYKQIEKCARVSYKSEDKITETSSKAFVDNLIKANHYAPLEFGTVYLKVYTISEDEWNKRVCLHPKTVTLNDARDYLRRNPTYDKKGNENWWSKESRHIAYRIFAKYADNPYSKTNVKVIQHAVCPNGTALITQDSLVPTVNVAPQQLINYINVICVTTNLRVIIENGWEEDLKYLCEPTEYHHKRYCVKFILSRDIAQEFTRHRTFSYCMESQRFVNYSKDKYGGEITYIIPSWLNVKNNTYIEISKYLPKNYIGSIMKATNLTEPNDIDFLAALLHSEIIYLGLLCGENKLQPQQARGVLPNATKTELVMCGFEDDWKHFFDLRLRGTTGAPHPDAKEVAQMAWILFKDNYKIEL